MAPTLRWIAFLSLMFVSPVLAIPDEPALLLEAPRYLTAEWTEDGIKLAWVAPTGTAASGAPTGYLIEVTRDGVPGTPVDFEDDTLEYVDESADDAQAVSYRVSALYGTHGSSAAAVQVAMRPYPYCTWLVTSYNPPDVIFRPECLIP